jgi:hypothetical protein
MPSLLKDGGNGKCNENKDLASNEIYIVARELSCVFKMLPESLPAFPVCYRRCRP